MRSDRAADRPSAGIASVSGEPGLRHMTEGPASQPERSRERYIYLGSFLDQVLNRDCRLSSAGRLHVPGDPGGLRVPLDRWRAAGEDPYGIRGPANPGIGNVVIMGGPGTGKTTLALHMAQACCRRPDNRRYLAAYISLEEEHYRLRDKARPYGWSALLQRMDSRQNVTRPPGAQQMGAWLRDAIDRAREKVAKEMAMRGPTHAESSWFAHPRPVLVPRLSPRSLSADGEKSLFWTRYRQLETLLTAGQALRERMEAADIHAAPDRGTHGPHLQQAADVSGAGDHCDDGYDLRLVVLDSLSVFGDQLLTREELFRVFDLFSRTGVIGVVIVEDKASFGPGIDEQHMETIDSLADVVIQLSAEKEKGYFRRSIEIVKSRYSSNVLGKHAVKLNSSSTFRDPFAHTRTHHPPLRDRVGFIILPSMHYYISQQGAHSRPTQPEEADQRLKFGHKKLAGILPPNYRGTWTVTIAGPRHTFKTALAVNYLLRGAWQQPGACEGEPETVLLIRLHDNTLFDPQEQFVGKVVIWREFRRKLHTQQKGKMLTQSATVSLAAWRMGCRSDHLTAEALSRFEEIGEDPTAGTLIELTLQTGAQLAEDAVGWIWEVLHQAGRLGCPIRRAVLDDVNRIGISFPFLESSETSQRLFITGVAHLFRQQGIGLVMVGTTGEHPVADEIVQRACNVSDTVIRTGHCNVFGKRYVTINGEGLSRTPVGSSEATVEPIPLTIRAHNEQYSASFDVDDEQLSGLVGLEAGGGASVSRGKARVYLFEDQPRHAAYNDRIEYLLQLAFGVPADRSGQAWQNPASRGAKPWRPGASEPSNRESPAEIRTYRFGSQEAEVVFEATQEQYEQGAPSDATIVSAMDEFVADGPLRHRFAPLFRDAEGRLHRTALYYRNVLLALTRDTTCWSAWSDRPLTWKALADRTSSGIYYDTTATESLTCLFLDALFEARPPYAFDTALDFVGYINSMTKDQETTGLVAENLLALSKVLAAGVASAEDADTLLCWFSQARYLLDSAAARDPRPPEPNRNAIAVRCHSLPGSGFTGDWHLGVLKGSPNLRLGERIVDLMRSGQEQFSRLLEGIGLPPLEGPQARTWDQDSFRAFDVGARPVTLREVMGIHSAARHRSSIPDYFRIRKLLHHAACHLRDLGRQFRGHDGELRERVVTEVRRLSKTIPAVLD